MHNKNSKRQRKQKASQSLKGKQQAPRLDALDLLGEELQQDAELDEDLGSNALILPAAGTAGGSGKGAAAKQQPQQQLSKSQLKKLRQVQLKKERRQQLGEVLTQLNSSSLPDEQLSLLRPLHQRGARETKKQRLRRLLKLQRAGYEGFEGCNELLQERQVQGVAGSSSSSSESEGGSSSESEDEHEQQRPAKQARTEPAAAASPAAAAAAAAGESSSSGDDSNSEQQQQQSEDGQEQAAHAEAAAAAAAADAKAQLRAVKAQAAALRAQARLEATGTTVDEAEAEEAAAARAAAAERAAAAAADPTRVVSVVRPPEMEAARRQLPILGLEQEVMEGIARHDVVVLCGETGCGKTTQVPQFLLEAGYSCKDFPERAGAIAVTQPRRVAAISTAERVAGELGVALGSTVGYQVRHDRRVGSDSAIRFMTDGVLMRQLQSDFLLRGYSAILLDEAHERSLNTDLLLGMLSRLVPLRRRLHEQWLAAGQPPAPANTSAAAAAAAAGAAAAAAGSLGPVYPLKLIIMSATLRTSDFTENSRLFARPPPVLSVPARQFPVTIHFAKHTELDDYLATAVRKVYRIHQGLPGGGILLFLTGQREVQVAVRRIRQAFAKRTRGGAAAAAAAASTAVDAAAEEDEAADAAAAGADAAEIAADAADAALEQDLLDAAAGDAAAAAVDDFDLLEQDEDEEEVQVMGGDSWTPEELAAAEARFEAVYGLSFYNTPSNTQDAGGGGTISQQQGAAAGQQQQQRAAAPVHVLPLYAMLPQAQQAAVFQPVPAGHRLIVVATNVAETSITIPGIRYVVDAGRSKQKLLEAHSGAAVARYAVGWVSKAAAEQRAGRAGRTGPGHVYRLFSSAHFNDNFRQHSDPEIANTPLEGVVLLLKAMGVDKVSNFPFPSPPEAEALRSATSCLLALSALSPDPQPRQNPKPQQSAAAAAAAGAGKLTALGRAMAVFPITPRHSRMLLQLALWQQRQGPGSSSSSSSNGAGQLSGVSAAAVVKALPYAVALAAALSLESPFMHIDALGSEMESAAAAKESEQAGRAADDDPAAAAAAADAAAAAAAAKAENKKRAQSASQAHFRFRSSHGDAISSLNVLCAYEAAAAAGEAEEFCAANFLHARHLREMSQLRQQLGRTLLQLQQQQGKASGQQGLSLAHAPGLQQQEQQGGGGSSSGGEQASALQLLQLLLAAVQQVGAQKLTQQLPEPSVRTLEVLRRALAAGWCDQVSRRVRSADHVARLASDGRQGHHAVRYSPACLAEEVFLHPRSCLAKTAPEYVVYGDIVRTAKRPYMALVTAIEPQWLADCGSSLCKVSEPLSEPAPFYQPECDCVLAWHDAAYSQHSWQLPRLLLPHPDEPSCAAVFGAALLAGRVLPAAAALAGVLLAPAATAARQELQGLPRVGELLAALQGRKVFSRAALAAAWAQQPLFLKQQLALWVKQQQRHVLDSIWPQLLQQAAAAAAGAGGHSAAAARGKAAAAGSGSAGGSSASGKKRKKGKLV